MNKREKNKLLIDFFSKDLSEEQKKEFLHNAASDKDFIKAFLKGVEVNEVFEEVYGDRKDNGRKTCCSKGGIIKLISIIITTAAVIVIGLIIGINRYQISNDPGRALFEKYYEPFDLSLTRSISGTASLAHLYARYIMHDYQSIYSTEVNELQLDDSKEIAYIIHAVSAIELNQFETAENYLERISSEDKYYLISCWYKGLLLLREGEFQEASSFIEKVSGNSLLFHEDALEIQGYLKKKHLID